MVDAYENAEKVIKDLTDGIDLIGERLQDIAQWAVKEHSGTSVFDWLLSRIEDIVDAACPSKQPTLLKTMETYRPRGDRSQNSLGCCVLGKCVGIVTPRRAQRA